MRIDKAKSLASERGYRLECAGGHDWDLYDTKGNWLDSLHQLQIGEMDELAYIEFYLDDAEFVRSYEHEHYGDQV